MINLKKIISLAVILSYISLTFAETARLETVKPDSGNSPAASFTATPDSISPINSAGPQKQSSPAPSTVASPPREAASKASGGYASSYNLCLKSKITGRADAAEKHRTVGWGAFGFASGLLFGLIGVGASTLISIMPSPAPYQQPDIEQAPDLQCYSEAYTNKARSKNVVTTLGFSTVGWLISIPIVMAMKN